jgi:general secretion pathway protein K
MRRGARHSRSSATRRQGGVALLAAMLTVTLVATLASAALWRQWRGVEVEGAERARAQSAWAITGALDWARLILREDARLDGIDHLGEPWAVPLNETRLSGFLAAGADSGNPGDTEPGAFLSGRISDLQSRLNVANLVDGNAVSAPDAASFARLFELLGLPREQLDLLSSGLLQASRSASPEAVPDAPLMPQRVEQLRWLGLNPEVLARLAPYITLLPMRTAVNLNTAGAEVIYAATPGLVMADARRLLLAREHAYFRTLADASQSIGAAPGQFSGGRHAVSSRFFEVRGRLRLGASVMEERSLLRRDGQSVRTLARERHVSVETLPGPAAQ